MNVLVLGSNGQLGRCFKDQFNKSLSGKVVTNISEIKNYCKAEDYHQKYIEKKIK